MRSMLALLVLAILTVGPAQAADEYLGSWGAGSKEIMTVSQEGESLIVEIIRKNVAAEYESVRFPAKVVDGILVISFDLGNVSAKYDDSKELLMLGGVKEFEKLSNEQATAQKVALQEKLSAK